jgi:predicted GNAT superfamily acetyltransferase
MYRDKTIGVIVPAYNEEKLIGIVFGWGGYKTASVMESKGVAWFSVK